MLKEKSKISKTVFILGIICVVWIIVDIVLLLIDLHGVIFFELSGLIVGIGYIFILLFHILFFIYLFNIYRIGQRYKQIIPSVILFIVSLFALAVQKVMYDEVGREYYLENSIPGETYFIYFGLILNLIFIMYGTIFANKSSN
ncbi:MAG: hypothetical protein ABFS12_18095 [Bacteroidota bacterium]